ncbi:hypothetical protein ACSQ67_013748 [Phaseolus vulgaris]
MLGSLPILPLPAPPADGNLGPLPESQVSEERTYNEEQNKSNSASVPVPATVATHTRTIGIIHPPPDIRTIVDKTSQFVAKNGPEFEKRIIANNTGNVKFNFLNSSDPYHAYYQHRLAEFRAQNQSSGQQTPSQSTDSGVPESAPTAPVPDSNGIAAVEKFDVSAQFKPVRKVLEPLKQNSILFGFLKELQVLMPPKGLTEKLTKSVSDMTTVLERCVNRLEWERSQEQARQKAEDEIEQERIQMAMIDWHDFVVVETIDFVDEEDEELPPPMTIEVVIRRSKVSATEDDTVEPEKEVEMEMDEEEAQLVEEGMRAASLEDSDDGKQNEVRVTEDPEPPMRIVKNWKRPEERIPAERDSAKFVVSPITGELIPISEMSEHMRISLIDPKYKEQKERMFAKIRETTLAADDEISRNIVGLARTRPDIFGTTEEEVSNAVKAEIEKINDEQPKQVIWDGHTGSIGRTANQAMSQNIGNEDQNDTSNNEAKNLLGPAAPPPRPGMPSVRPLPPPPGLALNLPRGPVQYSVPHSGGLPIPPPRPLSMMPSVRPAPPPPMQMNSGQQSVMGGQPHPMPPMHMNNQGFQIPPPPGSQFTPVPVPRPYVPLPVPQSVMPMMHPPPLPQGVPPPPPPEEAPPPLPEEPEPKRQKLDDYALIPEDQFLAQHPGPVRISVSVPNVDEGNLKGQVLEITVQSLSETVGSLKEKIAGEIQLPANKQKLSGKPGFLKDNMSLAHYNLGGGETLTLTLRERGGRKR